MLKGKTALVTGSTSGIAAMMKNALAEFGTVDLLVNNAGIQHVAPRFPQ